MTQRLHPFLTASVLAAAGLLSATTPAAAQDAHYWTLQYGPRSALLGGAVIGSVDDVSATFYNPGAVALATDLAFAVSTDVFEYSSIALEDGGGDGIDLGTAKTGLRPSLVAGTITRDLFGGGGILAYSALTRSRGTQDLAGSVILEGQDLPPESGLDDAVGGADFTGRFNDFWGGLTYSHGLGENFGIGVTWYGAVRSQNRQLQSTAQFVETDGSGLSEIDNSSFSTSETCWYRSAGSRHNVRMMTSSIRGSTPTFSLGIANRPIGTCPVNIS